MRKLNGVLMALVMCGLVACSGSNTKKQAEEEFSWESETESDLTEDVKSNAILDAEKFIDASQSAAEDLIKQSQENAKELLKEASKSQNAKVQEAFEDAEEEIDEAFDNAQKEMDKAMKDAKKQLGY
jgi:F0F1-type ATP synthase membrane subunit b/b'